MKSYKKNWILSALLLMAFSVWTAAVCLVDVRPIGPQGSAVGFAAVNRFVHNLIGVHLTLYTITDWLSLVPFGVCACFGLLGLFQWCQRKSIGKVDRSILILGAFYSVVASVYLLFEVITINYRPVLLNGVMEGSYPSSTTMLVLCVMPTAVMECNARISHKPLKRSVGAGSILFAAFMVIGRILSGVHWFSDIVGGALLSAALVTGYCAAVSADREHRM